MLLCFALTVPLQADLLTGSTAPGSPAVFLVPANAGDNLVISVNSTPSGTLTSIDLYDPSNNIVAVAEGNGSDGDSSIIDWTALVSGDYTVYVLDPGSAAFRFSLEIEGSTGGASSPVSTVPEPSSASLCSLAVAALLVAQFGTRRRDRAKSRAV